MSFRFHNFKQKPFSATNFLSKIKEKNLKEFKELNINTIRSIQLTNNLEHNKHIKKELLQTNLEEELLKSQNNDKDNNLKNNLNIIKEYLPLMLAFNSYMPDETKILSDKRSLNDIEFSNIISCFQLLLKFIFESKENYEIINNLKEKKLSLLKEDLNLLNNNDIILQNNDIINKLENKKIKLQIFLKKNGIIPEIKKNKLYICNVCPYPYKKFYSYRDFHKHYVKNHINPYLSLNNVYSILNKGFDKLYFDNKINELTDEVTHIFRETKSDNNINNYNFFHKDSNIYGSRRNKRYETVGPNNNNISMELKNINKKSFSNDKKIRERLKNLEKNQKDFENNFKNQINLFLEEFKNEILNIKLNLDDQK